MALLLLGLENSHWVKMCNENGLSNPSGQLHLAQIVIGSLKSLFGSVIHNIQLRHHVALSCGIVSF